MVALLDKSLLCLNLSPRTSNALFNNGIDTIGDLALNSESDLAYLRGIGKRGLGEIKKALNAVGIQLAKKSKLRVNLSSGGEQSKHFDTDVVDRATLERSLHLYSEHFDERTLNALQRHGIFTIRDLIELDADEVRNVRGIGRKGHGMIMSFLVNKPYLKTSGIPRVKDVDISDLDIENRLIEILKFNSIETTKELKEKLTSLDDFLTLRFVAESDYKLLIQAIKTIENSRVDQESPIDIKDFIYEEIEKQKNNIRYVLKKRVIQGNTLEDVGQQLKLTRERVRQIEKKSLYIFNTIVATYFDNSISANDKCEKLFQTDLIILPFEYQKFLFLGKFQKAETNFLLKILDSLDYVEKFKVELRNSFDLDKIYVFARKEYSQIDFQKIYTYLTKRLDKVLDKIDIEDIYYELLVHKIINNEANAKGIVITYLRKILLYDKNFRFKIENDAILPIDVQYSTSTLINLIMKAENRPLHYTEIQELIKERYGIDLNARKVHGTLFKSDEYINVGKGMYALSSSGYSGQRVNDLMYSILKREGKPLPIKTLADIVLQKKKVNEGTVYAAVAYQGEKRFARYPNNKIGLLEWNLPGAIEKCKITYKYNVFEAFDILFKEGELNNEFTTKSYIALVKLRFGADASIKRSTIAQLFYKKLASKAIVLIEKTGRRKTHVYKLT